MVKLNQIYTRTGDDGSTGLGDGSRVSKAGTRVAALGAVDEANAALGLAALHATPDAKDLLVRIQNDLFDLGADLCVPTDTGSPRIRIQPNQTGWLEHSIDQINARLSPLTSFVLPGGHAAAAHLHMARTLVRRAERAVIILAAHESVSAEVIRYLNRLSDLLFVMARDANNAGRDDVLWQPRAFAAG